MGIEIRRAAYRGAVRPPFIEAAKTISKPATHPAIGGQSAPPSLKLIGFFRYFAVDILSGGSPPPLH